MKKPLLLLFLAAGLGSSPFAEAQTQKNCLIEEFTSSTCPPCAYMNAWLDPLLNNRNANKENSGLVVVKYQMNFPSPGTDASYNAHSQARASHYIAGMSSWGIPLHFTNGKWKDTLNGGGTNQNVVNNELDNCIGGPADLEITGHYYVKPVAPDKDSIFMEITITPSADLSGNYRLMVAATEEHYINNNVSTGHTTSQTDFYHVMRKMYPSANGTAITSFVNGVPQTFTFADEVTVGNVTKGSHKWWSNPFNGNLVAFVSDLSIPVRTAANVLQAVAIPAKWTTNVKDVANFKNIRVYPNPAVNQTGIFFNLATPTEISVSVMDMMGRIVHQEPARPYGTSAEKIILPTDHLPNGTYMIRLSSALGEMTQKLMISR